ncbi:Uncharacterised protein [Mycobacteroides abscessus subsp. massiliense]|nr:hypothetical protein [Mycobacteroides chelonae]SHX42931.1 Uncharacterised protein [Mycobacteroides abscessus subsp. abscessus]SKM68975.1 Uncharacterised protein [Mycobacteroides abscessus subsp. massiliense]MBF9350683.1 hypothetical protein [Mycobacteroides chelonae]SIL91343.1 Uncharacterised protein [Mycobacteroides abscessus subsp. abscessus]SKN34843.1 Uncharacterised protein [Mycobacteroides abscessus subsp. massiliense]
MGGGVIKADLEALDRLGKQIDALRTEMRGDIAGAAASPGASPALVALQQLATETLPNVGRAFVGWMGAFNDVRGAFLSGVIETEEHGVAVMRSIGNMSRNPTPYS